MQAPLSHLDMTWATSASTDHERYHACAATSLRWRCSEIRPKTTYYCGKSLMRQGAHLSDWLFSKRAMLSEIQSLSEAADELNLCSGTRRHICSSLTSKAHVDTAYCVRGYEGGGALTGSFGPGRRQDKSPRHLSDDGAFLLLLGSRQD